MQNSREELVELALIQEQIMYEKCSKRFATFFEFAWDVLEPMAPLKLNWHHELIGEYLEACRLRQIKKLIINMPPRYAKSNQVTVCFPDWVWTHEPHARFIFSAYAEGLSTKHSVDRRTLIESDWYQRGWGNKFQMASDQNVKTEFQNNKRGVMVATSMNGTATGKGGDYLIIDDPHDAMKVHQDLIRDKDVQSFDQKFRGRLDDKETGVTIVVMQRLHEKDLSGHLLAEGGWEHLKIEGVAEETKAIVFPMSGRTVMRDRGDLLHPARENQAIIDEQKKGLGSAGFAAQYQQTPQLAGGKLVDPNWFKFYGPGCEIEILPTSMSEVIQSWDTAFKDTSKSSFVCGMIWGRKDANCFLFPNWVHDQLSFVKTCDAIKRMTLNYPTARRKIIEDKANGPAVISSLQNTITGIKPYTPEDSKEGRLHAVSPMIESGNVWLPHPNICSQTNDLLNEIARFPDKPNDQVDTMTQALIYFQSRSRNDLRKMLKM